MKFLQEINFDRRCCTTQNRNSNVIDALQTSDDSAELYNKMDAIMKTVIEPRLN